MKIIPTDFNGLYLIENFNQNDVRGGFTKVFTYKLFENFGISFAPKEIYFSISRKDVIRGMHFQLPPEDHAKLIYVVSGTIIDVALDIRKGSNTFGKYYSLKIDTNKNSLLIPSGFAHGFKSLKDNTIVVYNQTTVYSKEHDTGILWNSFGYDWEVTKPIISERDKKLIPFELLHSPF